MSKSPRRAKRFFRIQFSLATLLAVTTLSAIGLWYWYQRPFTVENKWIDRADPFAPPPSGTQQWDRREVESVRRVWGGKTVLHGSKKTYDNQNRLLGLENYRDGKRHGEFIYYGADGKPLRLETYFNGHPHGPTRRWNAKGILIADENYSRGRREGAFEYRNADGELFARAVFHDDRPAGQWSWRPAPRPRGRAMLPSDFLRRPQPDTTLPTVVPLTPGRPGGAIVGQWREFLPDGRWVWRDPNGNVYLTAQFVDGRLTNCDPLTVHPRTLENIVYATAQLVEPFSFYFSPVNLEFREAPLKDVVSYIQQSATIPLRIDGRALEQQGISQDMPITAHIEDAPLLMALNELFAPHKLACDYRYGALCVVTADTIDGWRDKTGVTEMSPPPGSRLAGEWNKPTVVDVVRMPLGDVCLYLSEIHGIRINPSLMPASRKPGSKAAAIDEPVTVCARGLTLADSLGIVLDSIECQASLDGETIIIEPQLEKNR